jgi:hypothetical protein
MKTGRAERKPLDELRAFSLPWNRFSALEISGMCLRLPVQARTT